jgi:hypothetical protein
VICPAMRSRPFFISCGPVGNLPRDRFSHDCLLSHAVWSPGCYFPVGENRRHSRRLGWGAPVSGRQVLAFRLLRGGFRAPVSAGDFSISVSAGRRPVSGQRAVRRRPSGSGVRRRDRIRAGSRNVVWRWTRKALSGRESTPGASCAGNEPPGCLRHRRRALRSSGWPLPSAKAPRSWPRFMPISRKLAAMP